MADRWPGSGPISSTQTGHGWRRHQYTTTISLIDYDMEVRLCQHFSVHLGALGGAVRSDRGPRGGCASARWVQYMLGRIIQNMGSQDQKHCLLLFLHGKVRAETLAGSTTRVGYYCIQGLLLCRCEVSQECLVLSPDFPSGSLNHCRLCLVLWPFDIHTALIYVLECIP